MQLSCIQNEAQLRLSYLHRTTQSKAMAENRFWEITHCILHCKKVGPSSSRKNEVCENCIFKNKAMSMNRIISYPKILALFVRFPGPEPHMANIHNSTQKCDCVFVCIDKQSHFCTECFVAQCTVHMGCGFSPCSVSEQISFEISSLILPSCSK